MPLANDRFATRAAWWSTTNPGQLSETPVVANGYVRQRCPAGGAGGSFHFATNDGVQDRQFVLGDFDLAADVQCLRYDELDIPLDDGAPRAYGLAVHNVATPERIPGYTSRDYYHRVISPTVSGGASTARMISEWKYTVNAVSTWDTIDGQEVRDAAALGGQFDELGGRWWIRLRRVGNVITSWDAPQSDAVPAAGAWVNQHQQTVVLRELVYVGFVLYSSSAGGQLTGRCRAFVNYR